MYKYCWPPFNILSCLVYIFNHLALHLIIFHCLFQFTFSVTPLVSTCRRTTLQSLHRFEPNNQYRKHATLIHRPPVPRGCCFRFSRPRTCRWYVLILSDPTLIFDVFHTPKKSPAPPPPIGPLRISTDNLFQKSSLAPQNHRSRPKLLP